MLLNLSLFPRLRRLNPPARVEEGSGNHRDSETSGFLENSNEVERGGRGGTVGGTSGGLSGTCILTEGVVFCSSSFSRVDPAVLSSGVRLAGGRDMHGQHPGVWPQQDVEGSASPTVPLPSPALCFALILNDGFH